MAMGRFQFRIAVLPQDDRHLDQIFPAALAVASAEMKIDGEVLARPGLKLRTNWSVQPVSQQPQSHQ